MIQSGQYLNYIIEHLNIIRYELISKNKLNLTSDNITLENFLRDLLNLTYGYNLKNLNQLKKNFPGVDLGDDVAKVGVQITSTPSSKKVNDTLSKFINNNSYQQYNHLKVFVLTQKQQSYSILYDNSNFIFDKTKDILDFDDLYRDILYVDTETRRKICDLIAAEILSVMKSIGKDYYEQYDFRRVVKEVIEDDWEGNETDGYAITIKHCFGYLPSHIDVLINGVDIMIHKTRDENEVQLHSSRAIKCTLIIS